MINTITKIGITAAFALIPFITSAQQTLEEATDSIKNVYRLAKKGDAAAQNEVGGWYYRGRHVDRNYDEAIQWWAKSAKQGNVQAIGNMGLCYQTGHGVVADSLKAIQLYQRSIKEGNKALFAQNEDLAKKGNVFSCMLVASCYRTGIGVAKDTQKALPYLRTAAEKNNAEAIRDLGVMLLNDKKPEEAAGWFRKGVQSGDLTSTFYYGKMLLEGLGVKQDKKEGADYILKTAEKGFPQAMLRVGDCYMEGEGLTKNPEQGVKWYVKAAGKGVLQAQWALAQCYREGKGTNINYDRALYWYAQANANGYSRSFKNLIADSIPDSPFIAYLNGMKAYMNKDFEEASKLFKIVSKAKIADGKVMEGAVMANPNNPKHNMKKGVALLNEASKTSPQAMYLLGSLYEAGKGVDKDMSVAVAYMKKAAESGYGPAECSLADMYYEGRGVEQSYDKAVEWYGKAYEQGELNENAARRYAVCYEEGLGGLAKDKDEAERQLKGDYRSHIAELLKEI